VSRIIFPLFIVQSVPDMVISRGDAEARREKKRAISHRGTETRRRKPKFSLCLCASV